jgi:hypothetical protein
MASKKRNICEKGRVFKEDWTSEYFFIESDGKPVCLTCQRTVYVSAITRANIKENLIVSLVKLGKGKSAI